MIANKHIRQLKKAIDKINPIENECWSVLKQIAFYRKLDKNEYFSREGEFPKEFGFICNGIIRVFYLSENGEEWNKYFFRENDFIAAGPDPDKESPTNLQALTSVTLICFPYPKFTELLRKFARLNAFFQKLTLDYLEKKQEKEIRFLSNKTTDNYLYFRENYPDLEGTIPHYHIASYLGITPTQLSRIRKKLKKDQSH
ncbi:MAG: Crp/Fnr family transcriptional regulator [Calditrichaeota bacterium]|nr:Crp/Fnr family transcriptional regulator [Calditrichota bacterium]